MMKFGSSKQNDEVSNASKVTVLSLGFELTGDVISKNDIRADGILCGNIRTDKKVVVGEKASIIGDILADEISISGEVVGDLFINGETTIYATAKVSGNIITNQIFIHKGAELNTSIKTDSVESIKRGKESSKLKKPELVKTYSLMESREEKSEEEIEKKEEVEATIEPINKKFHRSW
ncbi:MAG: polymer-forming cytoskeletal protein [Anditalea sp.]